MCESEICADERARLQSVVDALSNAPAGALGADEAEQLRRANAALRDQNVRLPRGLTRAADRS